MNVWITKYALTSGVTLVNADVINERMVQVNKITIFHKPDWHDTRRGAVERVEQMRQTKIARLRKQLAKLEAKTEWAEELNQ